MLSVYIIVILYQSLAIWVATVLVNLVPLFRFKAVELPSPMQTPSDGETKFEGRKKSQSSQVCL